MAGGHRTDLTTCATLMSCFDFGHRGFVDREDWRRGTHMMQLAEMGEDDHLWTQLLKKYGGDIDDAIALDRLADFVPLDPRVNLMMKAMVASVSAVTEKLDRAQSRAKNQASSAANKAILLWRRRILEPVWQAWRDMFRQKKSLGNRAARAALNSSLGKAYRQWRQMAEDAADAKYRMGRFARRLQNRGLAMAFNSWVEQYEETLRMRGLMRRFASPGLVRAFNQWLESVADAKERNRQLRKGLGRLVHREILACWDHWSQTSLAQAQRMRNVRKLVRVLLPAAYPRAAQALLDPRRFFLRKRCARARALCLSPSRLPSASLVIAPALFAPRPVLHSHLTPLPTLAPVPSSRVTLSRLCCSCCSCGDG